MKTGNGTVVMVAAMMVAGAVLAGAARGAPMERLKADALKNGEAGVAKRLAALGLAEPGDQAEVMADWEQETVVRVALRAKAYRVVAHFIAPSEMQPESLQQVREALAREQGCPGYIADLVRLLPVGERDAHREKIDLDVARRYEDRPVFGRMYAKYNVFRNVGNTGPDVETPDLLALLLAPEPLAMKHADSIRQTLKDRAVKAARLTLRAEGRSFVIRDGVNPLAVRVEPVVTALNAPECAGLEAALRSVGIDAADADRAALRAAAAGWQALILSGELTGPVMATYLGKLCVALGVEPYNAFVDEYNHGKAGTP